MKAVRSIQLFQKWIHQDHGGEQQPALAYLGHV